MYFSIAFLYCCIVSVSFYTSNLISNWLIYSVEIHHEKISIFDSGPGMDGANGNIGKWYEVLQSCGLINISC